MLILIWLCVAKSSLNNAGKSMPTTGWGRETLGDFIVAVVLMLHNGTCKPQWTADAEDI